MPPKKQYPLWAYLCGCSVTSATNALEEGALSFPVLRFWPLFWLLFPFYRPKNFGFQFGCSFVEYLVYQFGILIRLEIWYLGCENGSWWFCIQFSILIKNICSFEVLDVFFTVLWFLIDPNAPWLISIHSLKGALIAVSAFANKASRNVTKTNLFTLSFKSVKRFFLGR